MKIKDQNTEQLLRSMAFYSLTLPEGNSTLVISYYGYESQERKNVQLTQNIRLDVRLSEPAGQELEVVTRLLRKNRMRI